MGERGEVFSLKVFVERGRLTYFFNVKENRFGDLFLNIVESAKGEGEVFKRYSIIIFQEDLALFMAEYEKAVASLRSGESGEPEFSSEIATGSGRRQYSFQVKQSGDDLMLSLGESREVAKTSFRRASVRVKAESAEKFSEGLSKAVEFLQGQTS